MADINSVSPALSWKITILRCLQGSYHDLRPMADRLAWAFWIGKQSLSRHYCSHVNMNSSRGMGRILSPISNGMCRDCIALLYTGALLSQYGVFPAWGIGHRKRTIVVFQRGPVNQRLLSVIWWSFHPTIFPWKYCDGVFMPRGFSSRVVILNI